MQKYHLRVTVGSHSFCCDQLTPRGRELCIGFAMRFVQYKLIPFQGRLVEQKDKIYATSPEDRKEFRFHINALCEFNEYLIGKQNGGELVSWCKKPMYEAERVELKIRSGWVLRDDQIPIRDFLTAPITQSTEIFDHLGENNKLVGVEPGYGKTVSACVSASKIGMRMAIIIKPSFIGKWVSDCGKIFEVETDDVVVVQGGASLMTLLSQAKEGTLTAKIIIISNRTYANYIKAYERYGKELITQGYDVLPEDFFEATKIGLRLIDEVHMELHSCFKLDMYTHVPQSIALSATLVSNDPFIKKMQYIAYPQAQRYKAPPPSRYTDSFSVFYNIANMNPIQTEERGGRGYSHNAYEKSLLKQPVVLDNYMKLLEWVIANGWTNMARKEKKLLIFASSVDMCTKMVEHLKKKYPERDIRRYVGEDDYVDLIDSEWCVSTVGSSGTAVDLPNLTTVIMTTAIASLQSNIQALGRLRDLKTDPTHFYFYTCTDIPKHLEYCEKKKTDVLDKRTKSYRPVYSGFVL